MIKILKYFIEAIAIYFFFLFGKIFGLFLSRKFFSFTFKILGPFFRSKNIIDENLDRFPKKLSKSEKKIIAKSMWSNYGKTFIEYIFLKKFRNSNSHIEIKGEHILDNILKNNQQVIFISGHFSNFELMSMELTKKKY